MNPYDPDAALTAIRPRLEAARSRRRRSVGASAAVAMLAMSSVAYAAVIAPSDDTSTVVIADDGAGLDDDPIDTSPADSLGEDAGDGGVGDDVDLTPSAPEDPAPMAEPPAAAPPQTPAAPPAPETQTSDPPPAPPKDATPTSEAPKPTTSTTAPAQTQTLTFTYPGTGSVTVTQTGNTLAFVSAAAEPGWSHKVSHQAPDLIGVEFTRDNVQRWLKVKVHNGVAKAEQHEHVKCVPPPGSATYQAPNGSGSVTVKVDGVGRLSLVSADPTSGWNTQILHDKPDMVKVGFWGDSVNVWILVKVHDCALKVETG